MGISWDKRYSILKSIIFSLLFFIIIFSMFYFGVDNTAKSGALETKNTLEKAIRRAVVQCYAIEGMYPPSIDYLEKNYGLIIDHENYEVYYEVFASNILPNIVVVPLNTLLED